MSAHKGPGREKKVPEIISSLSYTGAYMGLFGSCGREVCVTNVL